MSSPPSSPIAANHTGRSRWTRRGWIALVCLLLWLAASELWNRYWTATPGEGPVAADGSFDVPINIRPQEHWALNLDFHAGQLTTREFTLRTNPWKHTPAPSDTGISLHWQLLDANGGSAAGGSEVFHQVNSWGSDMVSSQLALPPLAPGRYRLIGELGPLPDTTNGMEMKVSISLINGKAWSSWQIEVAWWSALLNVLVIWPLTIVLLLMLPVRALWRRWRQAPSR